MRDMKRIKIEALINRLKKYQDDEKEYVVFQSPDSGGWSNILKFIRFEEQSCKSNEVAMLFD